MSISMYEATTGVHKKNALKNSLMWTMHKLDIVSFGLYLTLLFNVIIDMSCEVSKHE